MSRTITQREFRNQSAAVMDAVEAGETVLVTRNGTPVAEVRPVPRKPVFVNTEEMQRIFALSPSPDYALMRADIDAFYGDDDRITGEDDS